MTTRIFIITLPRNPKRVKNTGVLFFRRVTPYYVCYKSSDLASRSICIIHQCLLFAMRMIIFHEKLPLGFLKSSFVVVGIPKFDSRKMVLCSTRGENGFSTKRATFVLFFMRKRDLFLASVIQINFVALQIIFSTKKNSFRAKNLLPQSTMNGKLWYGCGNAWLTKRHGFTARAEAEFVKKSSRTRIIRYFMHRKEAKKLRFWG